MFIYLKRKERSKKLSVKILNITLNVRFPTLPISFLQFYKFIERDYLGLLALLAFRSNLARFFWLESMWVKDVLFKRERVYVARSDEFSKCSQLSSDENSI